jgi:hypothetical protein
MIQLIRVFAFPAALLASLFTSYAAKYELPLSLLVCLGMIVFAQHALRVREYLWAAELIAIAVVFSPILLIAKLFLLMGLVFSVACAALFTAVRVPPPPLPATGPNPASRTRKTSPGFRLH